MGKKASAAKKGTAAKKKTGVCGRKRGAAGAEAASKSKSRTGAATKPPGERIGKIIQILKKEWPNATTALRHENAFQLLVATILSAQCTDERVNQVTEKLFKRYRRPGDFARADRKELEELIRPTGYYRNKAKSIQEASRALEEEFGGEVPRNMEDMLKLPGVARKTANVVLGTAYGIPTGIVVDTHVRRVSQRLGLVSSRNPEKIEKELMELVPRKEWIGFGHRMIWHGRTVCKARRPLCDQCPLRELCPSAGKV